MKKIALLTGLLMVVSSSLNAQTTNISDNFNITPNGNGFNLGEGINTGINPPETRMNGTVVEDLRYIQTATGRSANLYNINSNRLRVQTEANNTIGRFTLSANGSTPFDFSSGLGSAYASPTNPATYDLKITMRNNATSNARFSFAIATAESAAGDWDFGVQLYRANSSHDYYTMQRRINANSSINGANINSSMGTTEPGVLNINFLIRVTDAGAETNSYSSRVQVSIDDGATWIYDTQNEIPNGFRFDGLGRYILFDQAGNNSGAVFYDNFSIVSTYAPEPPPAVVWTGGGTNDNWSTAANWGGVAPTAGTPLVFDGTARQANVNDLFDLTVPSVSFNNGGFSLSGNPFSISSVVSNLSGINIIGTDLSWNAVALKSWNIATGSEVLLQNNTSIEVNGDNTLLDGGTLRVKGNMSIGQMTTANPPFLIIDGRHVIDNGSFASRGGYRIGSSASGSVAETILTNGATFNLTVSGANLRVGDSANPNTSRLIVDNSILTMMGGSLGVPYAAGATGEVLQNGGTVSGGAVAFNDAGAGTGTYAIQNGGILEPTVIRKDTTGGSSSIYFNNAILRPAGNANSNFFGGLDVAEIQSGGLTLEANIDVNISQSLSGTGGLTKSGFATATLSGANTFSGNTVVETGRLLLTTGASLASPVQVADGAEFGVVVTAEGATASAGSLSLGGGSFSTLHFDLGAFGTPTAPLLNVSSLAASGTVTINVVNGLQLSTGQIVLIDYAGTLVGGFNYIIGGLPPGVTATLSNNVANSSIDLVITGVPGYRWTGAVNSEWDYGTENWIDLQNNSASVYADGFPLEFLDGAANANINLSAFPLPSIISVSNNTLPYVWNNGAITVPKLKKSGTNSLTRVEGGADFITEIELNDGSYAVSDSFDVNFVSTLTDEGIGSGTFVKQGVNTLTMAATNSTYDGAVRIEEGILKLGHENAPLGTTNGPTIITDGGTLDLNNLVVPHEPVFVSGAGVGGIGAIIDSVTGNGVAHNLTDVTLFGDTTLGSPAGRWDIRMRSGTGIAPGLRGNGFNLTKVGPGTLSIAAQRHFGDNTPYWEMNLGDVFVNEGTLVFAESLGLGNPTKTITIAAGATLGTYDLRATNPIVRNIFMMGGAITGGGGGGDTNIFTGTIELTGVNQLRPLDNYLVIDGPLVGTGSLDVSATGNGVLQLNGNNTFSGDTIVMNGTIGGNGSLAGNFLMIDGILAPGTGVGTFTVNGDATLAGITQMEVNRNASPNSDRLVVGGTLSFGGILNVVLAANPQAGDVYQLFNKGSVSAFTAVNLPDISGLPGGLAWNTDNLAVNGTISVTGTAVPPTIGSVSTDGSNIILSGTGGIEGHEYIVLSSTNVALPVVNWTPVSTNVFGPGGVFSYTNNINPAAPETFFLLLVP